MRPLKCMQQMQDIMHCMQELMHARLKTFNSQSVVKCVCTNCERALKTFNTRKPAKQICSVAKEIEVFGMVSALLRKYFETFFVDARSQSHMKCCPLSQETLGNIKTQILYTMCIFLHLWLQSKKFGKQMHFADKLFYTLPTYFLLYLNNDAILI